MLHPYLSLIFFIAENENSVNSPFRKPISKGGNAIHFLYSSWRKEDIRKMAQAMPPLIKATGSLPKEEQDSICYHEMPAGAGHYICGPNKDDELVLSHLFVPKHMVRDAWAWDHMAEAKATLLKKKGQENEDDEEKKTISSLMWTSLTSNLI
jgi:hypothetical protein